uniref:Beta-lactamase n=1 Tax=Solibacter usitatus (strain Ellin6076) TaxID=234267 RepID=Q01XS6_SOLUE
MTRRTLALLCLLSAAAAGQKPPVDTRARIDRVFAQFNRTDSPGCAVGVSLDGATVASLAYGMADLEHDVPLRPDSIFEPGSVTKQFTAAAVLLLAQQGKLSLDDPARKYLPELPDYGAPLTIRHLLNHTSGLRDWGSVEAIAGWPRTTRAYTHAHVLDILSRQRSLNYTPGAEYSYTNSGYNLAAILVGRVSGKPLAEFTRDALFTPLGMTSTSWRDDFRRIVKDRAIAYSQNGGVVRQLMPFEDVHGNGGLLTTVGDLLRWNQKFTIAHQLDQGKLNDGRTIAYAAGLMVLHYKGLNEISHSGTTAGYNAWLGRYPDQNLSVAVLCNSSAANGTQLGHAVADIFLGDADKAEPPRTMAPAKSGLYRSLRDHSTIEAGAGSRNEFVGDRMRVPSEMDGGTWYERVEPWTPSPGELAALTGEYTSDEAEVTFRVAVEQGRLVIHRRPDAVIALTPAYKDAFRSSLGTVRFLRNAAGGVNELSVSESRVWDLRFRKLR